MATTYTAGEIASMIKRMGRMNLALLGNTTTDQNTYIFYYMTLAMWKFAGLVFNVKVSDALTVTSDGYVTFEKDGTDIDDLYGQIRIIILNPDGSDKTELGKRTSYADPKNGWWRESANSQIHIRGAGTYKMHYKSYSRKITAETDTLDFPATSYDLLIYTTIGMIKESLNDIAGANEAYAVADKTIPVLIKANIDAQGTTGGQPPSQNEAQYYRRG